MIGVSIGANILQDYLDTCTGVCARIGVQRRRHASVVVRAAAAAPTKVAEKQYKLGGKFDLKVSTQTLLVII